MYDISLAWNSLCLSQISHNTNIVNTGIDANLQPRQSTNFYQTAGKGKQKQYHCSEIDYVSRLFNLKIQRRADWKISGSPTPEFQIMFYL